MDSFEHAGTVIAFDVAGSGPAVLFLHNGGASSTIWRHQVADLSAGHRTIAVDLPGFGSSPLPSTPLDLDGLIDLVGALLDHLAVDRLVVVGNCMGSNIAAGLAVARPDLVEGLVLVNPLTEATFSAGWLGPLHRMARIAPAPTRVVRQVARRIVSPRAGAVATLRFQLGAKGIARRLHHDDALLAANQRREQLPALVDVLDDMSAYGRLDRITENLAVPVCTIWGAQNRVLSPRAGARLNRRLAPQRAEVIEGCGHFPMLEDPDAVTTIIEAFIDLPSARHALDVPDSLDQRGAVPPLDSFEALDRALAITTTELQP
jgi:pimeloyl-ACP methyl ester carboxylesterase